MHAEKTRKSIPAFLAIAGLLLGSLVGVSAPAIAAASINGCNNSGWQPASCGGTGTQAVVNVLSPDISGTTGSAITTTNYSYTVAGCTPSQFRLYASSDTSYSNALTRVVGIDFSGSTGQFSGTPTSAQAQTGYLVLVTCSSGDFQRFSLNITVTAGTAVPYLTPDSLTISGTTGTAITNSAALVASNITAPVTYSVTTGSLPTGLSLNTSTGVISGTPTATSSATIVVTGANGGTSATANVTFNITAPTPTITPSTQTVSGTAGSAISATTAFTATHFTASPTYSVSPALPAGLSINSSTGVISGTPNAAISSTNYTVTATYNSETATATVTISASAVAAAIEPDRKVTICHRTHATTNPYVRITVDYNAVNKKSGHQGHDEIFAGEHVFKAGIYVRAKDKDWGDIIPADPSGLNRWQPLNWTSLGAAIYNGTALGCPSYDPVKYYNALRESGVPEKQIKKEMADLETEQSEANPSREKKDPSTLKYTGTNTKALEEENDKVTICHRTNSVTNPYVKITVAASSIYKNAGHYGHDEIYNGNHVFDSTVNYPNNRKDWGDIIPADPTGKNRWAALNMTTLGKAIYNGTVPGCAEKSTQEIYNELREEGKSKKEIMEDLEKQKNIDEDPKDLEELTYTGKDPEVEKTEPKEPVAPSNVKIPDQSLSGIVWLDHNEDGLKDQDEPYLSNVEVTLTGKDAKTGKEITLKLKTDSKGFYVFPGIEPGEWKVEATIPQDLKVTYDSYLLGDGTAIATVPVASSAFTWVGLVGVDPKVTRAFVAALSKAGPGASVKFDSNGNMVVVPLKKASSGSAGTELAATGSNQLAWLAFGMLMALAGALLLITRKAYQN